MNDKLEKRTRRSRVPVSEKLKAIDARIARMDNAIDVLKVERGLIVSAHLAKVEAMKAEVE